MNTLVQLPAVKVKWMCDLFCLKVPYKCIIDHKRKQSFYLGHLKLRSSCLKFYPHILQPHKHWCAATAVDANTDKISKCQWHGCQKQGVWGVLWASVLQNLFFSDFLSVCQFLSSLSIVYMPREFLNQFKSPSLSNIQGLIVKG